MKVNLERIRQQYAEMTDEELNAVGRNELTDEARNCLYEEAGRRDPRKLQTFLEHDAREEAQKARRAELDRLDPEPKPKWYMRLAAAMACVTTIVVAVDVWVLIQHERPMGDASWIGLAGSWIAAFGIHVRYWWAKAEWRERRRRGGAPSGDSIHE